ncbi:MAG TPA: hypoxanthine phosphoribosyltransferase [Bacillota bacterium]|nr:hypoxanthine phosphoribosyltransferase [Bacillota bacterium]HOJ84196.1 hypoxanthine phosphoribosyltransferase [Bacillota bacterium]HOL14601.1 hypoxanthine phosphoribosyltransferase [Bacillota bacterium]HPZ10769.1 hypoxanthine phosphoribosyltransferase [Bacillota bacterium]
MKDEKLKLLLGGEEIAGRVAELAELISAEYEGRKVLLICVLKGAVIFASDLMRRLKIPVEIDFIAVSSYGSDTASSGVVRILKDLDRSIKGKDVLIVEDIVDTGLTLNYLRKNLLSRQPRSLRVVTLLDKPARRRVEFTPDYCGFEIPDYFVVGYGLDFNEDYRHLAGIYVLNTEC